MIEIYLVGPSGAYRARAAPWGLLYDLCHLLDDMFRFCANPANQRRAWRRLEGQADEIQTGRFPDDPEAAAELSLVLEGRRKSLENFAVSLEPRLRWGCPKSTFWDSPKHR